MIFRTHELPKFHYWAYQTLTGFTGILLTMVLMGMFVFAMPYSRRHTYRAFWFTHHMYVIVIILTFLHGMGRMIQPPFTHFFFLGPIILFTLDTPLAARASIPCPGILPGIYKVNKMFAAVITANTDAFYCTSGRLSTEKEQYPSRQGIEALP